MSRLPRGLPRLSVRQLDRLLRSNALTSTELCNYVYTLALAGERIWKLNAFSQLATREELIEQAQESDCNRKRNSCSSLHGIPVSIKANIAVQSHPLTAGSKILGAGCADTRTPRIGFDADVTTSLLRRGGALLVGVTNMDEFGMGSLGTNVVSSDSDKTFTKNPLVLLKCIAGVKVMSDDDVLKFIRAPSDDLFELHITAMENLQDEQAYSAGGSSCGSAASVAHGSSIISLGSDTGGSVRLPAAWCGIAGLKPTYGLLSRHGLVSYASSLDCVGILAPTSDCIALTLDHLVKYNTDHDSTMCKQKDRVFCYDTKSTPKISDTKTLSGVKVGIPASFSVQECPESIRKVWSDCAEHLERLGAIVETVSTECISTQVLKKSLAAYYVIACAEASSNLARYEGLRYGVKADLNSDDFWSKEHNDLSILERQYMATRTQGFGPETARRVLCGTFVLSSDRFHTYYQAAARLRAILSSQMQRALNDHDMLLLPTALSLPVNISVNSTATNMFANDVMTVPVSLAGLPALSISLDPLNSDDGASPFRIGLQLVGSRLGEANMLRAAVALEQRYDNSREPTSLI
jgi:aspartyl-tRNA(Asn)/glutamyl-tRNA(Gln) amidotransferase subunit A